ncbi:MAG: putative metal-binding motif-containing protein, partial [Myxococcota bacterium]|nr:putative metal-binding motif-containing protein [Myxococcota bacterium]
DGHGDDSDSYTGCEQPSGYSDSDQDCDDGDAAINPDVDELCDGLDNDCDGLANFDAAGEVDGDGDGSLSCVDCDDAEPWNYPGNGELCDGLDNDCNGTTDEDHALDAPTWYRDADGDGWGDEAHTLAACEAEAQWVSLPGDCDDTRAGIHPGLEPLLVFDAQGLPVDLDCDGLLPPEMGPLIDLDGD